MQQTIRPVSKLKVFLLWSLLIGNLVFWLLFWTWGHRNHAPAAADEPGSDIGRAIFLFIVGCFFLVAGVGSYLLVIATNCLTFNFQKPFFNSYKGKLYLAKIIVPVLVSLGLAFILGAFLEPILTGFGLHGQITFLLPLFAGLIPLQIAQMWINIWAPVTRRLIAKRLAARGILPAQLQTALLTGISDPLRSSFKKLTLVEDDIGALWITSDRLMYWGDTDQFSILPGQIVELERRADSGSTSMLSGTAHVILHIQLPEGVRQIRLHTEGHWTQGRNRKAMDNLASLISQWHASARPPVMATHGI